MTVGIGAPFSSSCVAALKALQNSMMLTPRWPSAGPMGGDGFAAPAGTCSLMYPVIFLATSLTPQKVAGFVFRARGLNRVHLAEIQFHRGRAAEDADHDLELALFRV